MKLLPISSVAPAADSPDVSAPDEMELPLRADIEARPEGARAHAPHAVSVLPTLASTLRHAKPIAPHGDATHAALQATLRTLALGTDAEAQAATSAFLAARHTLSPDMAALHRDAIADHLDETQRMRFLERAVRIML